jgi:1,2-phenylacetyl-CoA epoxidase PaaB subunit
MAGLGISLEDSPEMALFYARQTEVRRERQQSQWIAGAPTLAA